jgi:hypothetical protein
MLGEISQLLEDTAGRGRADSLKKSIDFIFGSAFGRAIGRNVLFWLFTHTLIKQATEMRGSKESYSIEKILENT